jgi:hypothetical protein
LDNVGVHIVGVFPLVVAFSFIQAATFVRLIAYNAFISHIMLLSLLIFGEGMKVARWWVIEFCHLHFAALNGEHGNNEGGNLYRYTILPPSYLDY